MKFSYLGPQAISTVDFWYFITAMSMRNRTMGILALEDGLFVNLWIFDYLYVHLLQKSPSLPSLPHLSLSPARSPALPLSLLLLPSHPLLTP